MKLLLVSEGKHELEGALANLVLRASHRWDIDSMRVTDLRLRVHAGKGPGYFKKALRCVRYAQEQGYDACVLVIDEDGDTQRHRLLHQAQDDFSVTTLPRALGVAVRTFDAWMLADEHALSRCLHRVIERQPAPEAIRDPKGACAQLRDRSGIDMGLAAMYATLAGLVDLKTLEERCPVGFGRFSSRLRALP
jgi:hypothetical protein